MTRIILGASGTPTLYMGVRIGEKPFFIFPWRSEHRLRGGGKLMVSMSQDKKYVVQQINQLRKLPDVTFPADSPELRAFAMEKTKRHGVINVKPVEEAIWTRERKMAEQIKVLKELPRTKAREDYLRKLEAKTEKMKKYKVKFKAAKKRIATRKVAKKRIATRKVAKKWKEPTIAPTVLPQKYEAELYEPAEPDKKEMWIAVAAIGGIGAAIAIGAYAYSKKKR